MNIFREIFRGTNGDLSSKRIMGSILIFSGILIGYILALPTGMLHDSILIFTGSLLTSGMALLGVSVKEKKIKDYGQKDTEDEKNCN